MYTMADFVKVLFFISSRNTVVDGQATTANLDFLSYSERTASRAFFSVFAPIRSSLLFIIIVVIFFLLLPPALTPSAKAGYNLSSSGQLLRFSVKVNHSG